VLRNPVDTIQGKPAAMKRAALFGETIAPRRAKPIRVKSSQTRVPEPQMFEVLVLQGDKKEKVDFKQ
jgi:hypothetical protein